MKNFYFKGKKYLFFVALFSVLFYFTGVQPVNAQVKQITVKGVVSNPKGQTIPGVTVLVKGTTNGTVTDVNGKYTLSGVPANATLRFSFVGMQSKEIPVNNRSVINITLSPTSVGLNQVVVIGYGVQKKKSLTGSVVSVKGKKLAQMPEINMSSALEGHLPGLISITSSGEPGSDNATLLIRGNNTLGNNSPLVVVDGIPGRSLNRLDPADIKSITVLKGPMAAIYGARAANGVILITTKQGSTGKPKITIDFNRAWTRPTVIPKMADAATYAEMINELNIYRGTTPPYSAADIKKFKNGSDPWGHPNTNWFKAVYKPWAPQYRWDAIIQGGTKNMTYFVSVGSNYEDAIYKHSATYYSQANFRSNIDTKISKFVHLSVGLAGREENRHYPTRSAGAIYWMLFRGKPTQPAFWPNGLPGPDIEYGNNPVVITTNQTGFNLLKTYVFNSNAKLNISIPGVKGLSLVANGALDKRYENNKLWEKPWYLYTWDGHSYDSITKKPLLVKGKRGFQTPQLRQTMSDQQNITLNAYINYTHDFSEKNHMTAMLGFEQTQGNWMDFWAFRKYFVSDKIPQLFAGGNKDQNNSGTASHSARLSYFGRLNYSYMGKYLAQFVFREDGSYIFPKNHRFGFFPSVSVGWIISRETFWKNISHVVNYFKLRGSLGKTGNDRISPYQFLTQFAFDPSRTYTFNQTDEEKFLYQVNVPNPNITWEVANEKDVGLDAQLFNGELTISGDYFHNLRSHILWWRNASVPATTGLSLPMENIGKVENHGYEFSVGFKKKFGKLLFNVNVSGGYAQNKILYWDEPPGAPAYQKSTGHPMHTSLYYEAIGIFKDTAQINSYPHWPGARPGDIIFKDVNHDGVINGQDMVRINKTSLPTFTGAINFSLAYKRFNLDLMFQGATGGVRYHPPGNSGEIGNYFQDDAQGRWTVNNPNAKKPRAWTRNNPYWSNQPNTYWLRSTNYLRLKNVYLSYAIITNKAGIDNLRVYFTGTNLFTLDKLVNFDPETTGLGYPPNKVMNIGFNLTF